MRSRRSVRRVQAAVLKRLERWTARVSSDTISPSITAARPSHASLHSLLVLNDQSPVAIELQLVDPVVAFGQRLDDLGGHGRDERGACPLRVERLPFGGGPRFFFWLVMGTRRTTDVLPRLVRHLHVELDRRELLGGHADVCGETAASADPSGCWRRSGGQGSRRAPGRCTERPFPATRRRGRPRHGRRRTHAMAYGERLLVFLDEFGERGIGLGPLTERVIGHRQPGQPRAPRPLPAAFPQAPLRHRPSAAAPRHKLRALPMSPGSRLSAVAERIDGIVETSSVEVAPAQCGRDA